MTRRWTAERDERIIQVKERKVIKVQGIKERNKADENSETWGGRNEGGER
jgi:hypothetical protein